MQFYKLKVKALNKPIKDATTVTFDVPTALREQYAYYPGQHLVIKFKVADKEVRRTYSLNSCPYQEGEPLQITVKRVKDGLVSNFVNDKLQVGDELEVAPPQGRFYADIQADEYKTYFLFAAGSGITPILSILNSVLTVAPNSSVVLFYGNKNQDSILFKKVLDDWEKLFPERLDIVHILSSPKTWTSWEQWKGRIGRIDNANVEWFIENHPPVAQTTEYFICGPGAMNTGVRDTLVGLGVPKSYIHIEQFGGQIEEQQSNIPALDAQVKVQLNGQNHELQVPKWQTILQVLKAANTKPPYSCESGICGTCTARLTKGTAAMKACMALDDAEVAKGMILTCQALPTSAEVEVVF